MKSLVDKEIKQVEQGMCWATRYNPKTGKTEVCKHKTECELAIKFVEYSGFSQAENERGRLARTTELV